MRVPKILKTSTNCAKRRYEMDISYGGGGTNNCRDNPSIFLTNEVSPAPSEFHSTYQILSSVKDMIAYEYTVKLSFTCLGKDTF